MTIRAPCRVGVGKGRRLGRRLPACVLLLAAALAGCAPRAASGDRSSAGTSAELSPAEERGSPDGDSAAQTVALRFLDAAEQGDFVTAHALLAAPLRARYSPETLARDFGRDPLSRARLARARQAVIATTHPEPSSPGDGAVHYRIDERSALRLVKEAGSLKIAAIE